MAYFRKLPSGKWQATVRHPNGKRISNTDPLRRTVAKWAQDLEAQFARGEIRDPRAGRITVGEWYERWIQSRGIESVTRSKLESVWRTHCEPQWATWPMDAITHMEAKEWVKAMQLKRRARHRGVDARDDPDSPTIGASTVQAAGHLMSSLFLAATRERPPLVLSNPFTDLELPRSNPSAIEFLEHAEVEAIMQAMRDLRPDEPQWPLVVELGAWVGLRLQEIFGLPGDRVDWLRAKIQVTQVHTRHGLRQYPKTRKSHRIVPVASEGLLEDMSALMRGRPRDGLVFTSTEGGPIDDSRFRHRVWVPALARAGVAPHPPRILRHTAASWLVMDGVPLYDVQALLGHESFATTQRYAHLAPDAHGRILESWSRRTSDARGRGRNEKQAGA